MFSGILDVNSISGCGRASSKLAAYKANQFTAVLFGAYLGEWWQRHNVNPIFINKLPGAGMNGQQRYTESEWEWIVQSSEVGWP